MKILIAGSSGQLARSLQIASQSSDLQTILMGRPELDVTKPETLVEAMQIHQPDLVINAAAWTDVNGAEDHKEDAFAVNAAGAGALAIAAADQGIGIIHISTDYVYDGTGKKPYTELDPVAPLNVYGHSKLASEKLVAQANPKHLILRTSWVYSPFGKNFLTTVLRLAHEKTALEMVEDQWGCPTYAPHLAEAILQLSPRLLRNDEPTVGIYSLAGSGNTNWAGFATEILRQSANKNGPTAEVIPVPASQFQSPTARPAHSALDCSKAKEHFGITLPDWQTGVGECLDQVFDSK